MFTWLCMSWFEEKNTFLMRWCMTSIWNCRCQYSWVNSDQMNQMRSEVLRTCGNFHHFGFLCIVRILHPTCSHTRPQPEVPKIDGFGARPLGDGKLHPDVLKFRRRFLNQWCWSAISFDSSFKINPYFASAKGRLFEWPGLLYYYYYIYNCIYMYMCFFSSVW